MTTGIHRLIVPEMYNAFDLLQMHIVMVVVMDGPRSSVIWVSHISFVVNRNKTTNKQRYMTYVVQQTQTISHNPGGNNGELKYDSQLETTTISCL